MYLWSSLIHIFIDVCKQCFLISSQLRPRSLNVTGIISCRELFSALALLLHYIDKIWRHTYYWAISLDIFTVNCNWVALSSVDHLRSFYSLKCRVVQLKLVSSGCCCTNSLVSPKGTESVSHERKQVLVISYTLAAGQEGTGVHLSETNMVTTNSL